jgi:hypothetical protein
MVPFPLVYMLHLRAFLHLAGSSVLKFCQRVRTHGGNRAVRRSAHYRTGGTDENRIPEIKRRY